MSRNTFPKPNLKRLPFALLAVLALVCESLLKLLYHPATPGHVLSFIRNSPSYRGVIPKKRLIWARSPLTFLFNAGLDLLKQCQASCMKLLTCLKELQSGLGISQPHGICFE